MPLPILILPSMAQHPKQLYFTTTEQGHISNILETSYGNVLKLAILFIYNFGIKKKVNSSAHNLLSWNGPCLKATFLSLYVNLFKFCETIVKGNILTWS